MTSRQSVSLAAPEIEVITGRGVGDDARQEAKARMCTLIRATGEPISRCRVKLTKLAGPGVERPVVGQANLDVNGLPLRAQVTAGTIHEAIELLAARLGRRAEKLTRFDADRSQPTPGARPRVFEPTYRPSCQARPGPGRRIVRHKVVPAAPMTPDAAAFEMDLLDYDFHLFTNAETGQDSVIYRAGPTGYRLAQLRPGPLRARSAGIPLSVSPHPAPLLGLADAAHRLDTTALPFVFFMEPRSGRGHVLYRRFDGDFGLVAPAGSAP